MSDTAVTSNSLVPACAFCCAGSARSSTITDRSRTPCSSNSASMQRSAGARALVDGAAATAPAAPSGEPPVVAQAAANEATSAAARRAKLRVAVVVIRILPDRDERTRREGVRADVVVHLGRGAQLLGSGDRFNSPSPGRRRPYMPA